MQMQKKIKYKNNHSQIGRDCVSSGPSLIDTLAAASPCSLRKLNVVNGGRGSAQSKLPAQGHVPKHVTTKARRFLRASCCLRLSAQTIAACINSDPIRSTCLKRDNGVRDQRRTAARRDSATRARLVCNY